LLSKALDFYKRLPFLFQDLRLCLLRHGQNLDHQGRAVTPAGEAFQMGQSYVHLLIDNRLGYPVLSGYLRQGSLR